MQNPEKTRNCIRMAHKSAREQQKLKGNRKIKQLQTAIKGRFSAAFSASG